MKQSRIRQFLATFTAVLALIAAIFVVDDRYATADDLQKAQAGIKTEIDRKADRVLIEALIKAAHAQKVRELKREQWQIKRKPLLDETDRYMLQDIQTDIELLEE